MRIFAAVLLAVGSLFLSSIARAADPYEISVILPVTGSGAFIARADMNALSVIEQLVNKSGGIRGRPIKFAVQDDQSNPALSVQLLNGVLARHVPIVLGSTLAATCNAMAPLLKDGPVEYCFSPGIHPQEGSYIYSAGVGVTDLVAAIARYCRERGLKKIAVITSTDATGQDADRAVDQVFNAPENRTLAIVDREHFNATDVSVAGQMTHVKGSGADVLIAWSTGTPFATVLRGARDSGLELPMFSTNGNMSYTQMRQYTAILPKELLFPGLPSFGPDQLPNGALKNAVKRFLDAFKAAGIRPEAGENQVWDATLILIEALKKYGPDATPQQIRDFVNNLRGWTGIYGTFNYRMIPQRGVGIDAVIIQRWDPTQERWIGVSKPGGSPL
ncbi:MAG TPA: ABC transporter substrate-binding protein [Candidatus Binatia bacterium]|nr:ABC transporter substrate-binding protein [Candidatus Binatia bacterium]